MAFLSIALTPIQPTCNNLCNGSISSVISGGVSPYVTQWYKNNVPFATTPDISNLCAGVYKLVVTDSGGGATSLTKIFTFSASLGTAPGKGLLLASDGNLYGVTSSDGANGVGVIFKWDGTNYIKVYDFATAIGSIPIGAPIQAGVYLYGLAQGGGSHSHGVLYRFNIFTNVYTDLVDLNTDQSPFGSLVNVGGILYGMTSAGGANSKGAIFSYNISTNTYTRLFSFSGAADGQTPLGSLINVSGILYGMTSSGGSSNKGVIFSFNPSGNVQTVLHHFIGADGDQPTGDLLYYNGRFWGTTYQGGTNNLGVLFSLVGSSYTKLFDFALATGSHPTRGHLTVLNGILYGLASGGGANSDGVLFSYDGTYHDLYDFDGSPMSTPNGFLTIGADSNLYGQSTESGGGGIIGSLFKISVGVNTATATSTITAPAPITADGNITAPTCAGDNGSIAVTPSGGTAPYTYLWSTGATTQNLTGVPAGTYTLTITDANGCTGTISFTIPDGTQVTVLIETVLEKCFEAGITMTAVGDGGLAPYTYEWNTGETTQTIQGSAGYTYVVTATDSNGCQGTQTVVIPTQVENYYCCLAKEMGETAGKKIKGLKVCKCEDLKNALLYRMIQSYERFTKWWVALDKSQIVNNAAGSFGLTGSPISAQPFIPSLLGNNYQINKVVLIPGATANGVLVQDVIVSIYDDTSGHPNNILTSVTIPHATWTAAIGNPLEVIFNYPLTVGDTYYIGLTLATLVTGIDPFPTVRLNSLVGGLQRYDGVNWSVTTSSFWFKEYGQTQSDCLTDAQKQSIRDYLTATCSCCGCSSLSGVSSGVSNLNPRPAPPQGCKNTVTTTDPTVNDDISRGYCKLLSKWENSISGDVFICVDNSLAGAIWQKILFA